MLKQDEILTALRHDGNTFSRSQALLGNAYLQALLDVYVHTTPTPNSTKPTTPTTNWVESAEKPIKNSRK